MSPGGGAGSSSSPGYGQGRVRPDGAARGRASAAAGGPAGPEKWAEPARAGESFLLAGVSGSNFRQGGQAAPRGQHLGGIAFISSQLVPLPSTCLFHEGGVLSAAPRGVL